MNGTPLRSAPANATRSCRRSPPASCRGRGLRHIQVGRAAEVTALINDIDRIADDGAAIRFVIGEYGSGKTFFLNLVTARSRSKRSSSRSRRTSLPTAAFTAATGRRGASMPRPSGTCRRGRSPTAARWPSIMERFLTDAVRQAEAAEVSVDKVIDAKLAPLQDEVGGYDYTVVLKSYLRGSEKGDDDLQDGALRWIRGEFSTKTEARAILPVRNIIDDSSVYDSLKLLGDLREDRRLWRADGDLRRDGEPLQVAEFRRRETRTTSRFSASSTTPFRATSATSVFCSAERRSS